MSFSSRNLFILSKKLNPFLRGAFLKLIIDGKGRVFLEKRTTEEMERCFSREVSIKYNSKADIFIQERVKIKLVVRFFE